MRVLLIHNSGAADLPSGETVVFESEAAALRDRGIEVRTLTASPPVGRLANLGRANVFFSRRTEQRVLRLLKSFAPDVVHAHAILPDLTVSVLSACYQSEIPVVQTLHNYRWLCVEGGLFYRQAPCEACVGHSAGSGIWRRCARRSLLASSALTLNNLWNVHGGRLFRWIERFLPVSEFVRDVHLRGGFPASKLTVKYNGVQVTPRQPSERYVAFAGRLDAAKGTTILKELPALLPHVQFKVAGNGPEMQRLAAEIGSRVNVQLLGRVSATEAHELLARATCTIVPSLVPESFGLVAAQSLAAGVPTVVSRRGGLTELVEKSRGGIVIDPVSGAAAFARAIRDLWDNQEQAIAYGRRGQAFGASIWNSTEQPINWSIFIPKSSSHDDDPPWLETAHESRLESDS